MKRKYFPGVLVLLGLVGSVLPTISIKIAGGDQALKQALASLGPDALPKSQSAWALDSAGKVLLVGLALSAIFAAAIAATRLRRAFTVPMALAAGFLGFITTTMMKGFSHTKELGEGVSVNSSPGAGLIIIALVFAGLAVFGIYGTIRPDQKATS